MIAVTLDFGDSLLVEAKRGRTIDQQWIDDLFSRCSDHGVDTVFWRVSGGGVADYRSRVMEPVKPYCGERSADFVEVLRKFDLPEVAIAAARRHSVRIILFVTIADFFIVRPPADLGHAAFDAIRTANVPINRNGEPLLVSVDPVFSEHPEYCWTSRDGRYHYKGVPSLAVPEAAGRLLDQISELVEYEADGVYLCTRTHSKRPEWYGYTDTAPDAFGYEEPIRAEYETRHGVDIRTSEFDRDAWHRLKGEYLTQFLRRAKQIVASRNQSLLLGIKPDRLSYLWAGTGVRTDFLQLYKDWETWGSQGLLDGLVLITDRTIIDQLDFLPDFIQSVAPGCAVYPWLNLNGPPYRTADEVQRMLAATIAAGAAGAIYHEADDLRRHESDGAFDDKLWSALTANT